jgi:hypothetical protein
MTADAARQLDSAYSFGPQGHNRSHRAPCGTTMCAHVGTAAAMPYSALEFLHHRRPRRLPPRKDPGNRRFVPAALAALAFLALSGCPATSPVQPLSFQNSVADQTYPTGQAIAPLILPARRLRRPQFADLLPPPRHPGTGVLLRPTLPQRLADHPRLPSHVLHRNRRHRQQLTSVHHHHRTDQTLLPIPRRR